MENQTPAKKKLPAFVILGLIALVAALVLAVTNAVTKGPIKEHELAALREAFAAVMPADDYEQMTVPGDYDVRSLYAAKTGGEVIGYCVTASGMGYNGEVAVTLGVGLDGLVTGASVGDTSFAETPGFGARAKEPAFQEQFAGLDAVNGGSFEALSGATVTSTAVLNAVNKAFRCVDAVALNKGPAADPLVVFGAPAEKPAATAEPLTGNVLQGEAHGFQSDVTAQLTLDADGAIASIAFVTSGETEGFGTRVGEDAAFAEQFIGKAGPFTLGEGIDAVSGATVTSTAAVEAVNTALTAETSAAGELTGEAQGFQSTVKVALTVVDGAVASFSVDSSGETEGIGTRVGDDAAFAEQFIGKTGPFTLGEGIDAVSGATVTSTAAVEAANEALASAAAPAEQPVTSIASNENAELGVRADGAAVVLPNADYTGELNVALDVENGQVTGGALTEPAAEEPAEEPTAEPAAEEPTGLTATQHGFQSDVKVTVTLNDDNTVAAVTVDSTGETEGIGQKVGNDEAFLNQFVGKAAPFTIGENADAVSGATVTSKAVVAVLNELVPAGEVAEEPTEEPAEEPAGLTATQHGFQSDVKVTVTLNDDNTVASVVVDSTGETEGFGTRVGEDEAFLNQFVGKAAPFTIGENADAVSGATVTSKAVVAALNELVPAGEAAEEPAEEPTSEPAAEEPAAEEPAGLTGTQHGFQSDVKVTVTLNDDNTVASVTVDSSDETEGIGQKVGNDEAFLNQFVGKVAPFTIGENVDAVSGATVTSKAVVAALNELVPAGEVAEEPVAKEPTEEPAGLTATQHGFQSDVKVTVTLNDDNTVASVAVDSTGETEGIGQKVGNDEAFLNQFVGKAAPFTIGENADAVSGATVTSKAVVAALNELVPAGETAEEPAGLTATQHGFQSDVKVTVTLNEDNTVASVTVDSTGETEGFGTRVGEDEAFLNQFVGKAAPFTIGENVDVVSGATVTSKAVVAALNELVPAGEPAAEPAAEEPAGLTATQHGFQSDVKVTVTLNEDNTVASVVVDSTGETEGIGQKVGNDEAFLNQFVGKAAPFTIGENADAVSGATVTSKAVVAALNELVPAGEAAEEPAEEPTAEPAAEEPAGLTATQHGFQSDVKVTVTLNDDNTIASVTVDSTGETEGIGTRVGEDEAFLNQFVGKAAPFTIGENVDAVSGATVTSKAVVAALNELVPAGEPAEEPAGLTAAQRGFQSDVKVTVTLNDDNTVAAVTVDSTGETEGIGQKVGDDEAFLNQFVGKAAPFTIGENADAVSGATVTSKAVVAALNELVPAGETAEEPAEEPTEEPAAEEPAGLTATQHGFQSDVKVTVTLNDDNTVASVVVDSTGETEGIGQKVGSDEAFLNQFVGKAVPFTIGENVDAVSGATVTSKAVVAALNELVPAGEAAEEPAEEPTEEPAAEEPAGLTATQHGFQSDVKVTVTLNDDNTVASVTVDSTGETEGIGQKVGSDEAFLNQFVGKAAPFTIGENVDAVSGATVTSKAVVAALNELVPAGETVEEPAEEPETEQPAADLANKDVVGTAQGKFSEIVVRVTTDADGAVKAITVNASGETKNVGTRVMTNGKFVKQFYGKVAPFTLGDGIDALSGATVTCQAVVDAVNAALLGESAEEPAEEPEAEQSAVDLANKDVVGTAQGKFSEIVVRVVTDADGAVKAITVNASGETKNVGTRVMTNGKFVKQFYGKVAPFTLGDGIDALSGATVTCQAVVDAVNSALLGE